MRDLRIDNAKGVLILLVVLGHLLEFSAGWSTSLFSLLLTGIYMFHMPAFVFLSGMTAKTDGLGRRVANLLVILVAFQVIYVGLLVAKDGEFAGSLSQPYWLLWFLLSMVWWMILLPVIKRVPYSLAISIAIALVAGLVPWAGYPLSIARTLAFLPFFVAGVLYGEQIWNFLTIRNQGRLLALCAVVALAFFLNYYSVRNAWFYGSYRFDQLGVDALSGVLIRGGLIAAAAVAAMSVFVMTPKVKTFITKAGRNSLSVFLLHGLFVVAAGSSIGNLVKEVDSWLGAILLLMVSVVIVALLSANFLDSAIRNGARLVCEVIIYLTRKIMMVSNQKSESR